MAFGGGSFLAIETSKYNSFFKVIIIYLFLAKFCQERKG
jgi:hypothetical protein